MVYYDNAATSYPKPKEVIRAVEEALYHYGANPGRGGHDMALRTSEEIFRCRALLAEEMGLPEPERVLFTQNCTAAINIVLKGLLKPGDHVILSCLEHNAVARTVLKLEQRGISSSVAEVAEGKDERTIQNFLSLIRPDTKLIVMTHASNVFGIVLPVAEIARRAKEQGVLTLVDAAQSGGVLPIDMAEMGIDFLALAGHKGLYAPMGIGALLIHTEQRLDTLIEGGTGSDSTNLTQPEILPDRFESGTLNVPAICGLRAGIEVLRERGRETVYGYEMGLLQELYDELSRMKRVKLYTERPAVGRSAPVLSFTVEGRRSEETEKSLNRYGIAVRAGLHCAPMAHRHKNTLETGTVRLAPSYYNTRRESEFFLDSLQKIVRNE